MGSGLGGGVGRGGGKGRKEEGFPGDSWGVVCVLEEGKGIERVGDGAWTAQVGGECWWGIKEQEEESVVHHTGAGALL